MQCVFPRSDSPPICGSSIPRCSLLFSACGMFAKARAILSDSEQTTGALRAVMVRMMVVAVVLYALSDVVYRILNC